MELFKVCVAFDDGGDICLSDAFEHEDAICLMLNGHDAGPTWERAHPKRVLRVPKEQLKATADSLYYAFLLPRPLPAQLRTARQAADVPEGFTMEFYPDDIFDLQVQAEAAVSGKVHRTHRPPSSQLLSEMLP